MSTLRLGFTLAALGIIPLACGGNAAGTDGSGGTAAQGGSATGGASSTGGGSNLGGSSTGGAAQGGTGGDGGASGGLGGVSGGTGGASGGTGGASGGTGGASGGTGGASGGTGGVSGGTGGAETGGGGATGGGGTSSGGTSSGGAGGNAGAGGTLGSGGSVALAPTFPVSFIEAAGDVQSPERGFYRYVDVVGATNLDWVYDEGYSLAFSYVRLDDYRDASLPQSLLDDLADGLQAVRNAGLELVLRFAYNFGPWPDSEPDASKARILEHLAQLEPVLRANEDVIAVVQAGFIGAWGEWHTSTNGLLDDPQDRQDILEALLDALPPSRSVQLRYPPYKAEMYGNAPLTADTAFNGSHAARTGHHNDCFLSSDTDVGTYPSGQVETWKQYLEEDTQFVPMGGETCSVHDRGLCPSALAEMARLHFSYLNRDYDTDVIDRWIDDGCYDEIAQSMGYRLALRQATLPTAVPPGGRFRSVLTLENVGWAAPFNPRPVEIVISGASGSFRAVVPGLDPRRWLPGAPLELPVLIQLPTALPAGQYEIALALPSASPSVADRPEYAIRFANAGTWNDGRNVLGTFAVDTTAEGGVMNGVTELEVALDGS